MVVAQNSQPSADDPARTYHNRGTDHMHRGEFHNALPLFVLALRHGPAHRYTYYNRAKVHCVIGRSVDAISDLDQALQLDPHFAEAYHFRGLLHYKTGDFESAVSDLNQALRIAPENGHAELYRDRASLCTRQEYRYCNYMKGSSCDWTMSLGRAAYLKGLVPFFGRYEESD